MTATFRTLCDIDARLVAGGHHGLTGFWRAQAERCYTHPTARTLVARVGRGGAKSHTAAKIALNETLFGDWRIPPGERHFWAFVSKSKDEAAQRLLLLESFLRALGIPFDTKGDEIALRDTPRGFRVFACSVGAVSGFRCFGYSADELAKWNVEGTNPSGEVCASLNAMCITHPGARRLLISSPLGQLDYHAQRFDRGDTDDQVTAHAASWVANPAGITEEATHQAEPDERVWSREYAAEPQAGALAVFAPDAIDRAFGHDRKFAEASEPVLIVDPSSGKKDAWTWCVVRWATPAVAMPDVWMTEWQHYVDENGRQRSRPVQLVQRPTGEWVAWEAPKKAGYLLVEGVGGLEGRFFGDTHADDIVQRLADLCRSHRIRHVHADQREEYALASLFRTRGLSYFSHPYTATSKPDAVAHVRSWMRDGRLALPAHDKLKRELLAFEEKFTPSGALTFGARGSGHDDFACLVLTSALADLSGALKGSPFRVSGRRFEIQPGDRPSALNR